MGKKEVAGLVLIGLAAFMSIALISSIGATTGNGILDFIFGSSSDSSSVTTLNQIPNAKPSSNPRSNFAYGYPNPADGWSNRCQKPDVLRYAKPAFYDIIDSRDDDHNVFRNANRRLWFGPIFQSGFFIRGKTDVREAELNYHEVEIYEMPFGSLEDFNARPVIRTDGTNIVFDTVPTEDPRFYTKEFRGVGNDEESAIGNSILGANEYFNGVYIQGETIVINSKLDRSYVFGDSCGFVKEYEVLDSWIQDDGVTHEVNVEVTMGKLVK